MISKWLRARAVGPSGPCPAASRTRPASAATRVPDCKHLQQFSPADGLSPINRRVSDCRPPAPARRQRDNVITVGIVHVVNSWNSVDKVTKATATTYVASCLFTAITVSAFRTAKGVKTNTPARRFGLTGDLADRLSEFQTLRRFSGRRRIRRRLWRRQGNGSPRDGSIPGHRSRCTSPFRRAGDVPDGR